VALLPKVFYNFNRLLPLGFDPRCGPPSAALLLSMKRTFVYIDGFNLYFRALKNTPYKWLDLKKLSENILSSDHKITGIKYFTAIMTGREDPQAPIRQQTYIRALESFIPEISVHYGQFMSHNIWARLSDARQARYWDRGKENRISLSGMVPAKSSAEIIKTEEKGSDVNLAVHLLNDAWLDLYDAAFVISNDSDLAEAITLVKKQHCKKLVGIGIPEGKNSIPSKKLISVASFQKRIRKGVLGSSQLPNPIPGANIHKPLDW